MEENQNFALGGEDKTWPYLLKWGTIELRNQFLFQKVENFYCSEEIFSDK